MRLLLGIIVGSIFTLFIASTFNAPISNALEQQLNAWQPKLQRLVKAPKPESKATVLTSVEAPPLTEAAPEDIISTTAPEVTDRPDIAPLPVESLQEASVWTPFHSEASAMGFATHLTKKLDYPFSVKKQAPASYLVTFEYQNEIEHTALKQRIAAVTGMQSP